MPDELALSAMTAIAEALSDNENLDDVRNVVIGMIDLDDYKDKLPAIGIGWTEVQNEDDGAEYVNGICEVVVVGQRSNAVALATKIGDAVYAQLKAYCEPSTSLTQDIQGISSSGMRAMSGNIENRYVALVHVFWRVDI